MISSDLTWHDMKWRRRKITGYTHAKVAEGGKEDAIKVTEGITYRELGQPSLQPVSAIASPSSGQRRAWVWIMLVKRLVIRFHLSICVLWIFLVCSNGVILCACFRLVVPQNQDKKRNMKIFGAYRCDRPASFFSFVFSGSSNVFAFSLHSCLVVVCNRKRERGLGWAKADRSRYVWRRRLSLKRRIERKTPLV